MRILEILIGVGKNSYGQLGDATFTNSAVPVLVAGGHAFTMVSCGGAHVCALASNGEGWCWGTLFIVPAWLAAITFMSRLIHQIKVTWDAGDGANGRLGNNGTAHMNTPVLVLGGLVFQQIEAGGFSCGLSASDSRAYCWGKASRMLPCHECTLCTVLSF